MRWTDVKSSLPISKYLQRKDFHYTELLSLCGLKSGTLKCSTGNGTSFGGYVVVCIYKGTERFVLFQSLLCKSLKGRDFTDLYKVFRVLVFSLQGKTPHITFPNCFYFHRFINRYITCLFICFPHLGGSQMIFNRKTIITNQNFSWLRVKNQESLIHKSLIT